MPIIGKEPPEENTLNLKHVWMEARREDAHSLLLEKHEVAHLRDPVRSIRSSASYYGLAVRITTKPEGYYVRFLNGWGGKHALD